MSRLQIQTSLRDSESAFPTDCPPKAQLHLEPLNMKRGWVGQATTMLLVAWRRPHLVSFISDSTGFAKEMWLRPFAKPSSIQPMLKVLDPHHMVAIPLKGCSNVELIFGATGPAKQWSQQSLASNMDFYSFSRPGNSLAINKSIYIYIQIYVYVYDMYTYNANIIR